MNDINKIIEKLRVFLFKPKCIHNWEIIHQNEYSSCTRFLFLCKKCGKFKKKQI